MSATLISADSHVVEPPELWSTRLGSRYGMRVPHIAKNAGSGAYGDWSRTGELGGDWMVIEGIPPFPMALGTAGGFRGEDKARRLKSFEFHRDVLQSGFDAEARLRDQDKDGVAAEVLCPTYAARMFYIHDAELQRACLGAYNDWLVEYCAASPTRLIGVAAISTVDADEAVKELHRCLKKGMRSAGVWCVPPPELSFASSHYEKLWSAAEEADIPVNLHALPPLDTAQVIARTRPYFVENATMGLIEDFHLTSILFDAHIQKTLAQIILSGTLERHPKLKLVISEWGTGWLPYFLEKLDDCYLGPGGVPLKMKPSEYFRRQVWATFDRDLGMAADRVDFLQDRLMWSSDFPHVATSWPESQQSFAQISANMPASTKRKLSVDNVKSLYKLEVSI